MSIDSSVSTPIFEPPLPDPFPGEFRIQRLLGEGGFGKVWLADDLFIPRAVALKTVKLPVRTETGLAVLAALQNEAKLLAQVRHPNVVQVLAWRRAGDDDYMVLEYVAGGSLSDRLKSRLNDGLGPFDWQTAGRYIADVAEGLLEVHACGIVHRDIKPANILWDPKKDEARLSDFGISGHFGIAKTASGTAPFMAPEAFAGEATEKSDVYSLAVSLFQLTTGELPFQAATVDDLVKRIHAGLPEPDPRFDCVPETMERFLRRGLSAPADARPTLAQFTVTLRGLLNQTLTDTFSAPPTLAAVRPVDLRVLVSRDTGHGAYVPVTTQPFKSKRVRDIKRVPPPPLNVRLQTGDSLRLEIRVDRPGHLVVFNVGPTGNLNVLYPEAFDDGGDWPAVPANGTIVLDDINVTPPAGAERIVAVWSRAPRPFRLKDLPSLAERSPALVSAPYRATRDLVRVRQSMEQLRPEDWHATVLELEHR